MSGEPIELPSKRRGAAACPICKRPTVTDFRPFCSKRCADVDLGHWFSGVYAVPAVEADEEGEGASDL